MSFKLNDMPFIKFVDSVFYLIIYKLLLNMAGAVEEPNSISEEG